MFVVLLPHAQVRIIEVVPSSNTITIKNFGTDNVDISGYRLCARIRYTSDLTTGITINSGSMSLDGGEEVTFVAPGGASSSWSSLTSTSDLGLYLPTGSFGSASAMVDFTQWGSSGNGRESVAVSKGIWATGEFVSGDEPYTYTGDGSENGASFWQGTVGSEEEPLGIHDPGQLQIYPNPFVDQLNISNVAIQRGVTIQIYDVAGSLVYSSKVKTTGDTYTLGTAPLPRGIYLIEVVGREYLERSFAIKN